MYSFKNDYSEVAHINILRKLAEFSLEKNIGYGMDYHSENAKQHLKRHIGREDVDIHFMVGGTGTNKTVISHVLKPYEAVIACDTGHINVHETGTVEATGHKVVIAKGYDGKVSVEGIREVVKYHTDEHMVLPRMVYISDVTEIGTLYTLEELKNLSEVCKELGLYLYLDGARLGNAIVASDITLNDLAKYCDVFYIGATKNGSLLGEAVVIVNDDLKPNFRFSIKQNGGMYSKGFVAGICYEELFKGDLYFELAKNANACALRLKEGLTKLGVEFEFDSVTNQQFPIFSDEILAKIDEKYLYEVWTPMEGKKTIRLCTSWATKEEDIDIFLKDMEEILK